jgi:hypothetical protein
MNATSANLQVTVAISSTDLAEYILGANLLLYYIVFFGIA